MSKLDEILYKHRWWVDYPSDSPALDNEQAVEAIANVMLDLIGEDETHWTDHWGEEHNSITDTMRERNSMRAELRQKVNGLTESPEPCHCADPDAICLVHIPEALK